MLCGNTSHGVFQSWHALKTLLVEHVLDCMFSNNKMCVIVIRCFDTLHLNVFSTWCTNLLKENVKECYFHKTNPIYCFILWNEYYLKDLQQLKWKKKKCPQKTTNNNKRNLPRTTHLLQSLLIYFIFS